MYGGGGEEVVRCYSDISIKNTIFYKKHKKKTLILSLWQKISHTKYFATLMFFASHQKWWVPVFIIPPQMAEKKHPPKKIVDLTVLLKIMGFCWFWEMGPRKSIKSQKTQLLEILRKSGAACCIDSYARMFWSDIRV